MSGILVILSLTKFSVGISIDPLLWGFDLRIGKEEGFKFKLLTGFYYTKNYVDSSAYTWNPYKEIYQFDFLRPDYWYGIEGRGEYFFTNRNGIQPYLGLGIGYYREEKWDIEHKENDSLLFINPVKIRSYYAGVVSGVGCEIYPFLLLSNLLKIDKEKSKVISFNFEFDTYYKFLHHSEPLREEIFWEEPEISGIFLGAGIRINF